MKRIHFVAAVLAAGFLALAAVASAADAPKLTFNKDVAPIFFSNCVSCHRPGEIGQMSLMDYKSVRPWAKSIRKAVADKTMPPWHADSSLVKYLNDRSLNADQIKTILAWVDQGAAEGNPADLPAAPKFVEGWAMGTPDMVFDAKRDFTVPAEGNEIEYQAIPFKVDLKEDLYISQWEIRPKYINSIHHANLVLAPVSLDDAKAGGLVNTAVLKGGDYVGSYLPGSRPLKYPDGMAYRLPAGTSIAIQVHYVGTGKEITDHLQFGVKFAQGRIDKIIQVVGTDDSRFINIPPNDPNWGLIGEIKMLYDVKLISSGAHMHVRGKSYTTEVVRPDGTTQLVTKVPNYHWTWQTNYELAEPVFAPKGSTVRVTSIWDNSKNNPENPDPNITVHQGEWTHNEMINSWCHAYVADEKLGLKLVDGRITGKFDDAQTTPHPRILQTLPGTIAAKPLDPARPLAGTQKKPAAPAAGGN